MEQDQNISQAIRELRQVTGLPVSLGEIPEGTEEETAEKLKMLAKAYRGRYDRADFLRKLLGGTLSDSEIYSGSSRFHIPETGKRVLYLIEPENGGTEAAGKIIRQMFVSKSGDLYVETDGKRMALIRNAERKNAEEEELRTARTIVDMLNTEAMINACVGFADPAETLGELPEAYRKAALALRVGRTFYTNEHVFSSNTLGIGRLIYDLPEESCRTFLRELFGDGSPDDFDEETKAVIDALFENNLNISEAARQLYLHRNTLVYRIEKLHQQTGMDLRKFDDAVSLKLAMMIARKLKMQ